MNKLHTLHNQAMDLAFLGDQKLQSGDKEEALKLFSQAFKSEKEAAELAEAEGNPEPGLSILFRSAATLAYQCGELREAEKLVAHALAGNTPKDIAVELRELLQQIYSDNELMESRNELSLHIRIPKSESTMFNTIAKRMGWSSAIFRKIAVL